MCLKLTTCYLTKTSFHGLFHLIIKPGNTELPHNVMKINHVFETYNTLPYQKVVSSTIQFVAIIKPRNTQLSQKYYYKLKSIIFLKYVSLEAKNSNFKFK